MGDIRSINIGMKEEYGDKETCMEIAKEILASGAIKGVTEEEMAAEIYSHHYAKDFIEKMPKILRDTPIAKRMYESCDNGVDLSDYGDPDWRKMIYNLLYKFF